ncbi:MAG TPA: hypothetical protein VGF40_06650 [Thermoanaerobaculia bacterium]
MSNRRFITTTAVAAGATLIFAALVFAQVAPPAPPAPPDPATALAPVPPAPAVAAVPAAPAVTAVPAPPAPPATPRHHHGRIRMDDRNIRVSGETLVVESDGDTWVIDDPATVARFRGAIDDVERKAREMARVVSKMHPAIKAAEAIGRELENDPRIRDLQRDIERSVRAEIEKDLERDVNSDIERAVAQAEAAARRVEVVMKQHEEKLRQMEKELAKLEKEMDALEMKMEIDGDALENDLETILDEAFQKGLARKVK